MFRSRTLLLLLVLPGWLALSYLLRFSLMEDGQWVGICVLEPARWECQLRGALGLTIHWGVLGWGALASALLGFALPGVWGWRLAAAGLLLGIPATVLYTASLGVLAVVTASLRLVRR